MKGIQEKSIALYERTIKLVWILPKCTNSKHTQKYTVVKLQHLCLYVHNGGINIHNIDNEYRLSQLMTKTLNKGHPNTYSLCK